MYKTVANKNCNYLKRVRTSENISRMPESLEQSPTKSQRRLFVRGLVQPVCTSQNMHHYASVNPHEYLEEQLHNLKIGVWCVMSDVRIVTRFFHKTVNANRYVQNLFNPYVDQLTEDERLYGYFPGQFHFAHSVNRAFN
ncbi:hypothetical protein ANN_06768 [Periplaneta americana]|uniref:Uncharacterized protein n=1 Tax=Periplaneta americana TaxID=6978 RepID=A0ABQ8TEK8_PERAM|nr:hypothetical protein ANN_06768 [Periplaneta americana]